MDKGRNDQGRMMKVILRRFQLWERS